MNRLAELLGAMVIVAEVLVQYLLIQRGQSSLAFLILLFRIWSRVARGRASVRLTGGQSSKLAATTPRSMWKKMHPWISVLLKQEAGHLHFHHQVGCAFC